MNRITKKIITMVLTASLVFSLAACGSAKETDAKDTTAKNTDAKDASNTDSEGTDKKLHFVYVSPLLAHPIWMISKGGFEKACDELGIQGDWVGPQNISPEDMSKLVETAVAQKADAIITQGLVPAGPVKTAIDAGIPVLVVDSDIQDTDRLAFFGKDVKKQAELLYQSAKTKVGENTKIKASVQVAALNYQTAHDQIDALKEAFSSHPGGFELVNITESGSDKMISTTEWENTFQTYPDINVAINLAAEAGPACSKVVTDKGIREKVFVFGVDDTDETKELIKGGQLDGTIVTSFYNYGYQAAYWLYQNITEGKTPENAVNDAGTIMLTKDNLETYQEQLQVKVDLK